jgi:hypothetical protein
LILRCCIHLPLWYPVRCSLLRRPCHDEPWTRRSRPCTFTFCILCQYFNSFAVFNRDIICSVNFQSLSSYRFRHAPSSYKHQNALTTTQLLASRHLFRAWRGIQKYSSQISLLRNVKWYLGKLFARVYRKLYSATKPTRSSLKFSCVGYVNNLQIFCM